MLFCVHAFYAANNLYYETALVGYGKVKKGKVFPYSLPSVGPGADPGVQAVSPAGDVK